MTKIVKKCVVCGAEFEVGLARRATKFCSEECRAVRKQETLARSRKNFWARVYADPEKHAQIKEVARAWREKNKKRHYEYNKAYRQKNRERINQKAREYEASRKEKKRLYMRRYWEHEALERRYARELAYWNGLIERNEGYKC